MAGLVSNIHEPPHEILQAHDMCKLVAKTSSFKGQLKVSDFAWILNVHKTIGNQQQGQLFQYAHSGSQINLLFCSLICFSFSGLVLFCVCQGICIQGF